MVAVAALAAGCTSSTPAPSARVYPPQPAFAPSASLPETAAPAASATQAVLSADVSSAGKPLDVSRLLNASQGGYGPIHNLHWLEDQAAQMSSMGLREVRVDHVFDDGTYNVVHKDASGQVTYDFSALDSVLLPLVNNGIQPFLTLSFMPSALGESLYGPPSSTAAWGEAVTALVSHYRDLGHTGWGFEVWNEIDTGHWTGTIAEYNELYAASAAAVKAADSTALVGGGAASGLKSAGNWSGQFIDYLGANPSVPADFFSVHSYWSDAWDEGPASRQLLDAAGRVGLPIFLTEWNYLPNMTQGVGSGSDTNASPSGSSYVAKRLFRAIDSEASKFFYFSPIEGLLFNLPYNGDLGLITVDGHRKSPGNVFEMYSQLGSTVLPTEVTGEGAETQDVYGVVTKDAEGTSLSTILWNNTGTDAVISLALTGLPYKKSNFRVQQRDVSGTLGNGFADGSGIVVPTYPSANENAPTMSDQALAPAKAYEDQIIVPAHGVTSIRVTPTSQPVGAIDRSAEPAQTNLAATASGTTATSSSSVEDPSTGWGLGQLTDGRRHSFEFGDTPVAGWSSDAHPEPTATEWVQADLGSVKPIDTVVLWPRDSQTHGGAGFPDDFTVQGSADGTTWETLYTAAAYSKDKAVSGPQTFEFPAADYRYVKVEATTLTDGARAATPSYNFQLDELEAYRNGVLNGGLEAGTLDGWKATKNVTVQSASVRGGTQAMELSGEKVKASTLITGLLPSTTYTFGGHLRPESDKDAVTIVVRDFGGSRISTTVSRPQWAPGWVTFTTGPDATSASLEVSKKSGTGRAWADDFVLTQGPTAKPAKK